MPVARSAGLSIALLALAMCGPVFAAVAEPSAQTLCNAIGSEISVPRDAAAPASATKPGLPAASSAKASPRKSDMALEPSQGGGGDASLERRGRWKAFLPGTFK